jgi:hypothetical protein
MPIAEILLTLRRKIIAPSISMNLNSNPSTRAIA